MTMLSATIITRNEERNIERCLNSLIGVADEIIVVDSMSTDSTADICRRYGAKVTERQFAGYGSQRQYAASLAGGRYVLSIDADEVLTEELRRNLLELKRKGFEHRMYCFRVVNYVKVNTISRLCNALNMLSRPSVVVERIFVTNNNVFFKTDAVDRRSRHIVSAGS